MLTTRKKLLDFILLCNFDQGLYQNFFLRSRKLKKNQKVIWLKNHTDCEVFLGF